MISKTVAESRVEMAEVMTPNDANFLGKVFGGRLLALLDLVAYATASRFAGTICVTASFDRVDFLQPIEVGEIVICKGSVTYVGRTSVEVTIEVFAENVLLGVTKQTNTARVTMVAVDDKGKPQEVPRLVCESREDKYKFLEGKLRRELRGEQRAEFDARAKDFRSMSEAELDGLVSSPKIV